MLLVLCLVRLAKPVEDKVLGLWLNEFRKKSTRKVYCSGLRLFKRCLGIASLEEYLGSNPDAGADLRSFLVFMEGRPTATISAYTTAVRVFFMDHDVLLPENDWRKMKRRGFMPKRVRAWTRDKKPSKTMLKKILNYSTLQLRALVLYLLSSGARVGETLQLRIGDFDFDADPPRVHIRSEITKAGIGERTAYFSYEARDALKDWVRVKGTLKKRDGTGYFEDGLVFPFRYDTARFMWIRACDKAGYGDRDARTNRRIYHIHTLRKFFRSNVGLDLDVVHALMGHGMYLDDAYLRLDEEGEIAKQYLACMQNVSVYAVEDSALRERTEAITEENILMKKEFPSMKRELAEIREAFKRTDWDRK